MPTRLIYNIGQLAGIHSATQPLRGPELASLPSIHNAWLLIEDDRIADFGPMTEMPPELAKRREPRDPSVLNSVTGDSIDAAGGTILPAWCDSHTHLVFAGSRESEFVDKLKGLSYAEINAKGGGILNSARKLAATKEDDLFNSAWQRLNELTQLGTGAIEIKSGYGLTVEGELKMLRVIKRLKQKSPLAIKATFLGAHTYPAEFKENHQGYIDSIIYEMLPVIAKEGLADYIDVFCEKGFFSPEETETIVRAGMAHGLIPKIHANQLNLSGGVEVGVKLNALSVDHLETMDEHTINTLAASPTIGTLLPTAAFFLRMPFQPARQLIDAGCAIALATDFNPGSSPSGNMNLVVAIELYPDEHAPGRSHQRGDHQRRLCHVARRPAGEHHRRQKGEPDSHPPHPLPGLSALFLRHQPHRTGIYQRRTHLKQDYVRTEEKIKA
ncbi:imidazolonepropionase [Puia sp. P3]|uniref:imidazolonepropionase n=1 Tax=Puia sp. P3 TaxID=3423952 RepID=UPI003D6663FD